MCREKVYTPVSGNVQQPSVSKDVAASVKSSRNASLIKAQLAFSPDSPSVIDGPAPRRGRASSCSGSLGESPVSPPIQRSRRRSCEEDHITRFRPPLPYSPATSGPKALRPFLPLTPPLSPSGPSTPPRCRAASTDEGSRLRRPNPLELRVPSLGGPATPTRMPSQSLVSALQSQLTPSPVSKLSKHSKPWSASSTLEKVLVSVAQDANSNWRPYMEDGHCIVDPLPIRRCSGKDIDAKWAFFAVYDGHGGRQAVDWLEEYLHHLVAAELQNVRVAKSGHPEDSSVIAALTNAFKKVDVQLATLGAWKYGSTATVALMHTSFAGSMIYLANVGDSHAALVGGRHARIISVEHKASNPMEAARVQNEGGLISRKRVGGILSVSRALGDYQLKGDGGGVSCEPDVSIFQVDEDCRALVIASDGLWDVLSAADVQRIVQDSIEKAVEKRTNPTQVQDCLSNEASQALVDAALKQGTHDNVIALVAFL